MRGCACVRKYNCERACMSPHVTCNLPLWGLACHAEARVRVATVGRGRVGFPAARSRESDTLQTAARTSLASLCATGFKGFACERVQRKSEGEERRKICFSLCVLIRRSRLGCWPIGRQAYTMADLVKPESCCYLRSTVLTVHKARRFRRISELELFEQF